MQIFVADRFRNDPAAVQSTNGPNVPGSIAVVTELPLNLGSEFSLCCWFKPQTPHLLRDGRLLLFGATPPPITSDSVTNRSLCIRGNTISFYLYPGYPAVITAPDPVSYNTWHSAVATLSPQGMRLYLDGVMVTNNPSVTTSQLESGYIHMGSRICADFDEVRIYNRALPPSEVYQLYIAEAGPFVDLVKSDSLVEPSFSKLTISSNYQLQTSADLYTWTNAGAPFTATSTNMIYPQSWHVEEWGELYFRLQATP
jgi:hypothetical protein